MTCSHLVQDEQVVAVVCGSGASHVYRREPAGDRWCFGCRQRLPHENILIGDPPEAMSYYEPIWFQKCSRCGKDRTAFPGASW